MPVRSLIVLQFINSSMMSSEGGGVAYAAHIGGFGTGRILILFFNKKSIRKSVNFGTDFYSLFGLCFLPFSGARPSI